MNKLMEDELDLLRRERKENSNSTKEETNAFINDMNDWMLNDIYETLNQTKTKQKRKKGKIRLFLEKFIKLCETRN